MDVNGGQIQEIRGRLMRDEAGLSAWVIGTV